MSEPDCRVTLPSLHGMLSVTDVQAWCPLHVARHKYQNLAMQVKQSDQDTALRPAVQEGQCTAYGRRTGQKGKTQTSLKLKLRLWRSCRKNHRPHLSIRASTLRANPNSAARHTTATPNNRSNYTKQAEGAVSVQYCSPNVCLCPWRGKNQSEGIAHLTLAKLHSLHEKLFLCFLNLLVNFLVGQVPELRSFAELSVNDCHAAGARAGCWKGSCEGTLNYTFSTAQRAGAQHECRHEEMKYSKTD